VRENLLAGNLTNWSFARTFQTGSQTGQTSAVVATERLLAKESPGRGKVTVLPLLKVSLSAENFLTGNQAVWLSRSSP